MNAYNGECDKVSRLQARLEEATEDLEVRTSELKRLVEANRKMQMQMGEAEHRAKVDSSLVEGQSSLQKQHAELEDHFMR